ncbi:MAG TPA: hypothetical protein VK404_05100 [Spirosoma sp.]|nr:hypothetical protein [Spirosoma sp.]
MKWLLTFIGLVALFAHCHKDIPVVTTIHQRAADRAIALPDNAVVLRPLVGQSGRQNSREAVHSFGGRTTPGG